MSAEHEQEEEQEKNWARNGEQNGIEIVPLGLWNPRMMYVKLTQVSTKSRRTKY